MNDEYDLDQEDEWIDKGDLKAQKRAQKLENKDLKAQEKELKLQKRAEARERKEVKRIKTRERHDEGKYYFWEYNKFNFSKMKIIEVEFFFWTTLVLAINFLFASIFAVNVTDILRDLPLATSSIIFVFMFIDRFVQSAFSNVKNRNISLMVQRAIGIIYILLIFLYGVTLTIILANFKEAIEVKSWLVMNVIFSFTLIILKIISVSYYGTQMSPKEWY